MPTRDHAPASPADDAPLPPLSRAARPRSPVPARVVALLSVVVAAVALGAILATAPRSSQPDDPLTAATAPAWRAMGALSDELRQLRRGASRARARELARRAAGAVDGAIPGVEAVSLSAAAAPLRTRVLATLRADAAWIDAVGSTLANPRSPRRGALATLAKRAATATAAVAEELDAAEDTVGGTGRLLAATKSEI